MAKRGRLPAVVDTNVFVANFLTRSSESYNRRLVRSWMIERKFTLLLSAQIVDEYLKIFDERLGFDAQRIARWRKRFGDRGTTRHIVVRRKLEVSRDPKDNVFLATAKAGKALFFISNDRDLLEVSKPQQQTLNLEIVGPERYLEYLVQN